MAKHLPFRATTASGERFDIAFPLHPETASAVRVANVLAAVLEAIDREIGLDPKTGNGDVLQAVAMAMAVRAAQVQVAKRTTDALAQDLLATALEALDSATRGYERIGHA